MKLNKKISIAILIILGSVYLGYYIYSWEYRKPLFEIYFFSLNRGRSIFIRTPENKTILVGAGQNSEIIRELTKQMPFYKHNLDIVVIPSATSAQIGGFTEIIDRYAIEEVLIPQVIATSTILDQVIKNLREKKIHIKEVRKGDEIEIEKDFIIKIIFPDEDFKFNKTSLPELGLDIKYKQTSAYLLGNLSKTIQKSIAKNIGISSQQNILELYTSGAETKVSEALLNTIKPHYIWNTKEKTTSLISDGFSWEKIR